MKLNNVYVICIVLLVFIIQSCSDMNDLHQRYLDAGEIIYAAKVDSVTSGGGRNRIQLEIFIASQRIETVRVFWNDYKDSVDVAIGGKTGIFKQIVDNLVEQSYVFDLVSLDKFGNKSLPFEALGRSYGTTYQNSLLNVSIVSSKWLQNDTLSVTWGAADISSGAIATDIMYMSTTGDSVKVRNLVSNTDVVNKYPNYKSGTNFYTRTIYRPDSAAIDSFYTDYGLVGEVHPILEIQNGSFEYPQISGWSASVTIDNWVTSGNQVGLESNGCAYGPPDAPDGTQGALMQNIGSITQTLNCDGLAGTYKLTLQASQRQGNAQWLTVYFDNTLIGTFTPAGYAFQYFVSDPFTVTGGIHTVSIHGMNGTGDNTAFVDVVQLVEVK
jgi:hypothetical protein